MRRKRWTSEHDRQLASLVRDGKSDAEISHVMGFARCTVSDRRCAIGMQKADMAPTLCPGAVSAFHAAGLSDHAIGREVGANHETVRRIRHRLGLSTLNRAAVVKSVTAAVRRASEMSEGWPAIDRKALARWESLYGRRLWETYRETQGAPVAMPAPPASLIGCSAAMRAVAA